MITISITNQKGGVGKSTTALALGQALTQQGKRVLFIDLDPQGNTSYALRVKGNGYNALGILERPKTIKDEILKSNYGDVIASTPSLALADIRITETGKEYRLKEALELVKDNYDYCIIDNPPALGILVINALTVCDYVVIPANADIFSLQGIDDLYKTIDTIKKYCNPNLKVLGLLLTRYKARSTLTKDITEILEETAKNLKTKIFNTKIRECIALAEAQTVRKSIYDYAPNSNASEDYKNFIEELRKEIK